MFKPNEIVQLVKTSSSSLDGNEVKVVGIACMQDPALPGNIYIVEKLNGTFIDGWKCMAITSSCLERIYEK